jgi:hypothetical protein
MFDFFANPELSKSQRLAIRRNQKRLLKDLRRNYRNFQKIEKQLNENRGLVEYLDKSIEEGILDAGTLAAFTELISRDPEIIKNLDLPDIDEDDDFLTRRATIEKIMKKHKEASLQLDLEKLEPKVKKAEDLEELYDKPSDEVSEYLIDEFHNNNIDTSKMKIFVDENTENLGGRIIVVVGPLLEISRVQIYYDLSTSDLYNKNFWERKKAA